MVREEIIKEAKSTLEDPEKVSSTDKKAMAALYKAMHDGKLSKALTNIGFGRSHKIWKQISSIGDDIFMYTA